MLGEKVEFPVSFAVWGVGTVIAYNDKIGEITVLTEEGETFIGCESQVCFLNYIC